MPEQTNHAKPAQREHQSTALDAISKSMRLKALKGDVRAAALLISLTEVHQITAEPEPAREIQIRFIKPDPAWVDRVERGE